MTKLNEDLLMGRLPFIMFLAFLGVLYISNTHRAEKKMLKIKKVEAELSEIKADLNNVNYQITSESSATELERTLREVDFETSPAFPKKIKSIENNR